MLRTLTLILATSALTVSVGACSPDMGFPSKTIKRADYGADWPLTVDEAVLGCDRGRPASPNVTVEGKTYGLLDWRDGRERPPMGLNLTVIWARDSNGSLMDMDPLLVDALKLCE